MGYRNAEELVKGSKSSNVQIVRLAEVTSLDSKGRAKVMFYGEDVEAGKTYNYIDGYIPEVGDKVLMLGQGNTYIIMGAVETEEVIVRYALKDHEHNEVYVTKETFENHNHDDVYAMKKTFEAHMHSVLKNNGKTLEVTEGGNVVPGGTSYGLGTEKVPFANGYIDNLVVTYVTIDGAKLEKEDLISKLISGDYYVLLDKTALIPYTNNGISLGTSAKMFKNVYAEAVYVDGVEVSPTKVVSTSISGREVELIGNVFTPSMNEIVEIGSSSKRFLKMYGKTFYGDAFWLGDYALSPSKIYSDSRTDRYVEFAGNTFKPSNDELFDLGTSARQFNKIYAMQLFLGGLRIYPYRIVSDTYPASRYLDFTGDTLKPSGNGVYSLGNSSYQYKNVYAQNVYVNGSAVTTSDKRKKKFIRKLEDKYLDFFKKLRPVTFKYKKGTSNRTHAGFIAQEVEQSLQECGITNEEFGGLVIQDSGEYGLRYEEFIALQTAVIQELQNRVEKMERRLEEHGIKA